MTQEKNTQKKIVTPKTIGIVLVLLLLLVAFALSSGNNVQKTSTPAVVPSTPSPSENTVPAGVVDSDADQIQEDPIFVPASECPEGQILDKEGNCVKKVEQVEEKPAQLAVDFTKLLYPYAEWDSFCNQILWEDVDGKPLYSRVLLFKEAENLVVSIGYIDDNKNWNEVKRFITTDAYNNNSGLPERDDYHGSFVKIDDPDYFGGTLIVGVVFNPIRLNTKGYVYRNWDDGTMRRLCNDYNVDPVVYTGK